MPSIAETDPQKLGQYVGWTMLVSLAIGVISAFTLAKGIDINLSADVVSTAENMLHAETQLRAKAYVAALSFGLDLFILVGLYFLLRSTGRLLAFWCLLTSVTASALMLLGAVYAMNAAEIAGDQAYATLANEPERLMLTGLQATADYTSFHLGLVISMAAKAGFFYLFLKSNMIPKIISVWGLFASLFVAITIVSRDFFPMLGHSTITAAFMISNLIALISTGLYLALRGVRETSQR